MFPPRPVGSGDHGPGHRPGQENGQRQGGPANRARARASFTRRDPAPAFRLHRSAPRLPATLLPRLNHAECLLFSTAAPSHKFSCQVQAQAPYAYVLHQPAKVSRLKPASNLAGVCARLQQASAFCQPAKANSQTWRLFATLSSTFAHSPQVHPLTRASLPRGPAAWLVCCSSRPGKTGQLDLVWGIGGASPARASADGCDVRDLHRRRQRGGAPPPARVRGAASVLPVCCLDLLVAWSRGTEYFCCLTTAATNPPVIASPPGAHAVATRGGPT